MNLYFTMNFSLIGSGGYIAPRHIKAIKDIGGNLLFAFDPNLDGSIKNISPFFPECKIYKNFELFYLDFILAQESNKIDYVSIASPNFLHTSHIVFALTNGSNVICEKPLVLNYKDIEILEKFEKKCNKNVNSILQLRTHPSLLELKKIAENITKEHIFDISLKYIATRDANYLATWKGDLSLSGGIATNIGIHFFDMLLWIFGNLKDTKLNIKTDSTLEGEMHLERAKVKWLLSIDQNFLPPEANRKTTYRSIIVDGKEFEFSNVQNDLHTEVYRSVVANTGEFDLKQSKIALEALDKILS